jgi:DNA segregation ATPase FtsK/SpoIIIE, S-DNA-T family
VPDFVQTAPYDPSARGIARGMVYKFSARHDFLWIAWRSIRWLVLHPISLAGIVVGGWLWSLGLPFWWAVLLGSLPHFGSMGWGLGRLVAAALRRQNYSLLPTLSTKHTDTPSLLSMWWRIHRGWSTGVRKSGFLQPGRGGQIPYLRHWELTSGGMSAWVTCGKFGWTADDLATRAQTIAAGIKKCRTVTVTQGNYPGVARVDFAFSDPLTDIIPITALPVAPRGKLSCGLTDRGDPAYLWKHLGILMVGLPGSGKSNMLWTLIASALASGEPFELWVMDPAGGVELWEFSNGSPIVKEYAAKPADCRRLIKNLHDAMMQRMAGMAGQERLHTPTEAAPRWYLIIDELIRVHNNLGKETRGKTTTDYTKLFVEILSMGRKAAITTIALTQIPFGHSIGEQTRILFPQKLVFRSNDFMVTNSVFGSGSEALGAVASKISIKTPGIGYAIPEEDLKPVRIRGPYIPDGVATVIAQGFLPDGIPTARDGSGTAWHNHEHVLYRWDTPPEGVELDGKTYIGVLYVGISVDGLQRADQHLSNEAKAVLRSPGVTMTIVERFTVDTHPAEIAAGKTVRQVALGVEAPMIGQLGPPLNIAHNGSGRRRRKAIMA